MEAWGSGEIPATSVLEALMDAALAEAELAATEREVPVGAVVARLGGAVGGDPLGLIVGRGRDRRMQWNDPTAHAEILALREAGRETGDWRLEDCALVVTLEPCLMCAGAALLARVGLLVVGAANPKFGAVGGQMNALDHGGWNHKVRTVRGIREERCAVLLRDFFRGLRSGG